MLPPLPEWDALHPLVVHFPIGLLLVVPVFVLLAAIAGRHSTSFGVAGLVLLALGTLATFFAVATGEAAGRLAERSPEVNAVLERHEELAETARLVFAGLTVILTVIVFAPLVIRKPVRAPVRIGVCAAFLLLYAGGSIVLVNAAHEGGRLVHEFGVTSLVAKSAAPRGVAEAHQHVAFHRGREARESED